MHPKLPPEIQGASKEVRKHYLKVLALGHGERWALLCALQQPPGTKGTDRAFQEGRLDGNWLDDLPPRQAKRIVREAKAAGINISGKQYMSGLANKLGHCDPAAWVGDVGDLKRVAKERNLTVRGIVDIDGHEEAPVRRDINPRLAKELAKQEMAKSPGLSMRDAIAKVKAKHTPRWKKKV